jgi:hypothetical protein
MNFHASIQSSTGSLTPSPVAGAWLRRRRRLTWAEREELQQLLDELTGMARRETKWVRYVRFLASMTE